mgnify:CR=1 FL=1
MSMLKGKTALVTGSTSGIGLGIAIALARQGANIVLNGFGDVEAPRAQVLDAGKAAGIEVGYHGADMSKATDIEAMMKYAAAEFGRVDILVNNAGIIRREDAIDFSEQNWNEVMNINLNAVFFLSQAVAKIFIAQGNGGKIVNIGSMLSFQGGIRVPSYTASKSAVVGASGVPRCVRKTR